MSGCRASRSWKKSTSCSSDCRSPARSWAQIVRYPPSWVSRPKRKCRPRAGSQNGSPSMSKMTSPGEEPGTNTPVVGGEVGIAQRSPLADAEQDVHRTRLYLLDGGDRLRVEAELQHVGGLLRSGELGVEGFVAPGAQRGWLLDAFEEIGAAAPVAQDEGRLVDDLRPRPHRFDGRARGAGEVPLIGADDIDDPASFGAQTGQVRGLVLPALIAEQLAVIIGHVGMRAGAARDLERQRGEVTAFDVDVEVGAGQDEATARHLYHCRSIISMATAMTLHS